MNEGRGSTHRFQRSGVGSAPEPTYPSGRGTADASRRNNRIQRGMGKVAKSLSLRIFSQRTKGWCHSAATPQFEEWLRASIRNGEMRTFPMARDPSGKPLHWIGFMIHFWPRSLWHGEVGLLRSNRIWLAPREVEAFPDGDKSGTKRVDQRVIVIGRGRDAQSLHSARNRRIVNGLDINPVLREQ